MFSHNKKSVSQIFLQKMILDALTIKLYCFKLFFEKHFCLNNRPFVFSITDNHFDFGCHSNEISNEAKFLCSVLIACKISNRSNKRLLRYFTFIFSLSCGIASVTSYLSENEAETYKMATSILLKFLTLKLHIFCIQWIFKRHRKHMLHIIFGNIRSFHNMERLYHLSEVFMVIQITRMVIMADCMETMWAVILCLEISW